MLYIYYSVISLIISLLLDPLLFYIFFFFNDTATTEIYTLSLHDALPICGSRSSGRALSRNHRDRRHRLRHGEGCGRSDRSEEHTSELQSPCNLVCRLLLEKKKKLINKSSLINRTELL